jgi:hypothetical protein
VKLLASKENEKQLRKQLSDLLEELSKARTKPAKMPELSARRETCLRKEKGIREEAAQKASEDFNTKIREQEETINRLREQLTSAKTGRRARLAANAGRNSRIGCRGCAAQ